MNEERLYQIILSPYTSEKANIAMQDRGEYVFKVRGDADKNEIKQAVEFLFKAKVAAVRVLNVKKKPRRFGNIQGYSKPWKKAYVTLREGEKIEMVHQQP